MAGQLILNGGSLTGEAIFLWTDIQALPGGLHIAMPSTAPQVAPGAATRFVLG